MNENGKKMLIKIEDRHTSDGESYSSELLTTGFLVGNGENYSIIYDEKDEELKNCETTLIVEGDKRVTMLRTGAYSSELILEKERRRNCHYATPYGEFIMGVVASYIASDMAPDGGNLEFKYTIAMNSGFTSDNHLKITVKEAKGNVTLS